MKTKHIGICLLIVFSFLSCDDMLDIRKDGRIPYEEIFKDKDKTRAYLNSCFTNTSAIAPSFDYTSYCDEAQNAEVIKADSPFYGWYNGQSTAESFPVPTSNVWNSMFEGIRKCNVFIANIDEAEIIATEEEKEGWKCQALTLRALYYLQLIKRYGGVPIILDPLPVGSDLSNWRRESFSSCVKAILADCDTALESPTSVFRLYNSSTTAGMMTRAICHAIKSEAILYAVSPLWNDGVYTWDDALKITREAIEELKPSYALYSRNPAVDVAQDPYALFHITAPDVARRDKETILLLGGKLQIWKYAGMPDSPDMISAGPNPTQELVDAYEMANGEAPILGYEDANRLIPIINSNSGYDPQNPYVGRDPRFESSIYYNGANKNLSGTPKYIETYVGGSAGIDETDFTHTATGYYIRKFNRWDSARDNDADGYIRLFRYAEILLNFAEAAANAVGPEVPVDGMSAKDAVDAVRARANMPAFPSGMNKTDFLMKYRNERRIELAFEGHRYFDVRRWNMLEESDRFVTGMRITKNDNDSFSYQRFKFADRKTVDDKYYVFPIDKEEVNKCLSTTGVNWQNPGW